MLGVQDLILFQESEIGEMFSSQMEDDMIPVIILLCFNILILKVEEGKRNVSDLKEKIPPLKKIPLKQSTRSPFCKL